MRLILATRAGSSRDRTWSRSASRCKSLTVSVDKEACFASDDSEDFFVFRMEAGFDFLAERVELGARDRGRFLTGHRRLHGRSQTLELCKERVKA